MKTLLSWLALWILVADLYAQRPIRLVVDVISVPKSEAAGLVVLNSEEKWKRLTGMLDSKAAIAEYLVAITVSDGIKLRRTDGPPGFGGITMVPEGSLIEAIEERRYPTEFIPPEDESRWKSIITPTAEQIMEMTVIPEAYETRNIGMTLECGAASRGEQVELWLILGLTDLQDFWAYPLNQAVPGIPQPAFNRVSVQAEKITGRLGKPLFLQASDLVRGKPDQPVARTLFVFVTAIRD